MDEDHALIRATLVPAIVAILAAHNGISGVRRWIASLRQKRQGPFADDSIGLYGQSALNIAGEVIAERVR